MVAYSFQPRFVEPILARTKGGTIRAPRKDRNPFSGRPGGHARLGEELQLYTGMRTQHCKLVARVRCVAVERIALRFGSSLVGFASRGLYRLEDLDAFARFDGFADWPAMCAFWHPALEFEGWHIRWQALPV